MQAPWMELVRQQAEVIQRQQRIIEQQEKTIHHLQDVVQAQAQEIGQLKETVQHLRDEIALLKGIQPKPKIEPSRLGKEKNKTPPEKRPGSEKRDKTAALQIHETKTIRPDAIPPGSQLKGYREFTIQDLLITARNTLYRLERWESPEGQPIEAQLPSHLDGHFGNTLKSYILYQYFQCHVTEPLILEELHEFGIDISSGQINRILTEDKTPFHQEKDALLVEGLAVSPYIQADDTGARHDGKNGFGTVIAGQWFTWFKSTGSKSRINFLKLLRAGSKDYVLSEDALEYMKFNRLPHRPLETLRLGRGHVFASRKQWKRYLENVGVVGKRHVRIATEGALLGSLYAHGFSRDLLLLSDDAGQFKVHSILHALCWFHAERGVKCLLPYTQEQRKDWEKVRDQIWTYYRELKQYQQECLKGAEYPLWQRYLEIRFDDIFQTKTCFTSLNLALKKIHSNKIELLRGLHYPELPLHNNGSEREIREYVKFRKVSGGTRSPLGRQARDTFTSLKKTCRKLGISFWEYLNDRIAGLNHVPDLQELIRQQVAKPG